MDMKVMKVIFLYSFLAVKWLGIHFLFEKTQVVLKNLLVDCELLHLLAFLCQKGLFNITVNGNVSQQMKKSKNTTQIWRRGLLFSKITKNIDMQVHVSERSSGFLKVWKKQVIGFGGQEQPRKQPIKAQLCHEMEAAGT